MRLVHSRRAFNRVMSATALITLNAVVGQSEGAPAGPTRTSFSATPAQTASRGQHPPDWVDRPHALPAHRHRASSPSSRSVMCCSRAFTRPVPPAPLGGSMAGHLLVAMSWACSVKLATMLVSGNDRCGSRPIPVAFSQPLTARRASDQASMARWYGRLFATAAASRSAPDRSDVVCRLRDDVGAVLAAITGAEGLAVASSAGLSWGSGSAGFPGALQASASQGRTRVHLARWCSSIQRTQGFDARRAGRGLTAGMTEPSDGDFLLTAVVGVGRHWL